MNAAQLSQFRTQLDSWKPGQPLSFPLNCGELQLDLVVSESLSCQCKALRISSNRFAGAGPGELCAQAQSLASKLTYLLEPVQVIETDIEGHGVQIRSNPPLKVERSVSYYELMLSRSELTLLRYTKCPGEARSIEPATFTREVLLRLIGDCEAILE